MFHNSSIEEVEDLIMKRAQDIYILKLIIFIFSILSYETAFSKSGYDIGNGGDAFIISSGELYPKECHYIAYDLLGATTDPTMTAYNDKSSLKFNIDNVNTLEVGLSKLEDRINHIYNISKSLAIDLNTVFNRTQWIPIDNENMPEVNDEIVIDERNDLKKFIKQAAVRSKINNTVIFNKEIFITGSRDQEFCSLIRPLDNRNKIALILHEAIQGLIPSDNTYQGNRGEYVLNITRLLMSNNANIMKGVKLFNYLFQTKKNRYQVNKYNKQSYSTL